MEQTVTESPRYLLEYNHSQKIRVFANAFQVVEKSYGATNSNLNEIRKNLTPEEYNNFAKKWLDAGAEIIGGCCGVGIDHIEALTQLKNAESTHLVGDGPNYLKKTHKNNKKTS